MRSRNENYNTLRIAFYIRLGWRVLGRWTLAAAYFKKRPCICRHICHRFFQLCVQLREEKFRWNMKTLALISNACSYWNPFWSSSVLASLWVPDLSSAVLQSVWDTLRNSQCSYIQYICIRLDLSYKYWRHVFLDEESLCNDNKCRPSVTTERLHWREPGYLRRCESVFSLSVSELAIIAWKWT